MDRSDKRLVTFYSYKEHSWFNKIWLKLSKQEIALCEEFICKNKDLDKTAFEMAVNRMFLEQNQKPKNWTIICELLTCSNSF